MFSDEERKIVGTAYKQESREKAIKIGLDFFGGKMRKMVEEVEELIGNRQLAIGNRQLAIGNRQLAIGKENTNNEPLPIANCLLIYCWRGGMRSAGVAWLMDLYGFKVYTLVGGYKKFRNHVLDTFKLPYNLKILGGYTGSGKTALLKSLREKGQNVVDLEAIANHKGSAFGNIGMPPQPTQEMFENLLGTELRSLLVESNEISGTLFRGSGGIWLEDESQRIGLVNIPHELWKTMRKSPVYFLDIPFEARLENIVKEYGELDIEKLIAAIERIMGKLGGLNGKNAISFLLEGQKREGFEILLQYYDKFYLKALHNREGINSLLTSIPCKSITPENANQLIQSIQYQPENT